MANPSFAPSERGLLDATAGPMHPAALATLTAAWEQGWADPRRLYREGRQARRLLDQSRAVLAEGLGVRPEELSFSPGGPGALREGLAGLCEAGRRRGARVVACAVEHSALLTTGRYAAAHAGDPARFAEVPVDRLGHVELDAWAEALAAEGSVEGHVGPVAGHREGTVAAALQSANGEVGTRQPLAAAHEVCRRHGIPLLVDATAGLGREATPESFDVLAGDARSWGGPAGVGVLVVPARTRWRPPGPPSELEGGRTHVEPVVPLVLAAAEAWRQLAVEAEQEAAAARALVEQIRRAAARVPEVEVVGDPVDRLPHVVTFSCLLADGEALVSEFDRRGFAVASGSACTASTLEPSHVLAAMGVLTHGNVRITLPLRAVAPDRERAVDAFCRELPEVVAVVRAQLAGR